jgi:urease gamma subunit
MKKENKYRSREERLANAASKQRGECIELFQKVSVPTSVHPDGEAYVKVATHVEGMRDGHDVRAVMAEKNIVGTVLPVRVMDTVTRVIHQVYSFVAPKQLPGEHGEELK